MRYFTIFVLALIVSVSIAYAQSDKYPFAEVVMGDVQYAISGDQTRQPTIYKNLDSGVTIPLYSIVRTGPDGYAEIKLAPNKTVKIYNSTTISLSKFQTESTVDLGAGKLRAIFKRLSQFDELKVRTETGIAAVRGTDFGIIYSKGQGNISLMEVFVREGIVQLTAANGRSVEIREGFSSTINSYLGTIEIEEPKPIQSSDFDRYFSEPQQVQQQPAQPQQLQPQQPVQPQQPTQPQQQLPQQQDSVPPDAMQPQFNFGWEISSQNINGFVWNKIVLSPILRVGKFGFGLYLVSYWDGKNNIYDTTKWYNSYEYNFGFSSEGFFITDFLDDLFKKVLFISYGTKGESVFIRIGSIPDMTLGHGFLMDRYSNMLGFPAIRRIGFQFDLDFGYWGFESAIADLSRSRLFGARTFVRPIYGTPVLGNIAIGISGVADLEPFVISNYAYEGNPTVFLIGSDIDFPIVDVGVFSLTLFADIGKAGIYINKLTDNPYLYFIAQQKNYSEGFNLLKGEGFSAGLKGMIVGIIPYRIEYRRITGQFIPSYFDTMYDAQKELKLFLLVASELPPFNGILGSSGFQVSNMLDFNITYEQLWPEEDINFSINRLIGRFKITKDIVKTLTGIPSYATVVYQRNNIQSAREFFEDVLRDSFVTLELAYSIDPNTDISISYKRFYVSSFEYQDSVSIQLKSAVFGEIGM
ncbi:MAG: FecR family protein [Spirochaetia bacterium]|nr:FecR family protein [Spirochaetota bacterium]MDW8112993.1 FecR family protein [Spirochaetia bacterium]